jgi:hypothetical protein
MHGKTMLQEPDYELLRHALAIIDAIPETAIAFGAPQRKHGPTPAGGMVCSPEGWLALHPAFIERGLSISAKGDALCMNGEPVTDTSPGFIVASVLGLPAHEAGQLFGDRDVFTGGDDSGLSDKSLWLRRMREYLRLKQQLGESAQACEQPRRL